MTLLTLAITIAAFFGFLILGLNLLPSTTQIPLDSHFATAITTVLGYYFAWSTVFTVLNDLWSAMLWAIGLEVAIFLWRMVRWVIGVVRGSKA